MSTRQCRDILAAVRWATALARGNVRALVLMVRVLLLSIASV